MTLERFRKNFRGLAGLTDYSVCGVGPEAALVRRLMNDRAVVPCKVNLQMMALVMLWRVACWPKSVTAVLTPGKREMQRLLDVAHDMLTFSERELRTRIFFHPTKLAISNAHATELAVVPIQSGSLGLDMPVTVEPFTVLIPDFDAIPGVHLAYLESTKRRPNTTVVANFVR